MIKKTENKNNDLYKLNYWQKHIYFVYFIFKINIKIKFHTEQDGMEFEEELNRNII